MKIKNYLRIFFWLLMLIGGAIISIHFDKIYFPQLFNNLYFHIITFIIGYFLLKMVLKASRNTGRYLAKSGREGDIPRMETNKLVTDGRYALMRHPMHFGLWFFPLAFALLIGSPFFIFVLAPLEMIFMILMIKLWEEPEARKKFGNAYDEYKKKVPFFCFKPDCIRSLLEDVYKEE
jgi:protein-S-isoprenylcysteine O-methyltransferase Ste14